jgi:protein-L-isoaspartate(D-aspartate) O-methyltransferase
MAAFSDAELAVVRRAYARQMLALAGAEGNTTLEAALAKIAREAFLGAPPWTISQYGTYRALPDTDPVVLYQDVLLALAPGRGVNNGSPSLHARWLHRLAPSPGEHVVHLGAGRGYYSAILAQLVGDTGRVLAVEYDAALAAEAREDLANLSQANLSQVSVVCGDAASWPQQPADLVYVNFSVTRPAAPWIEQLRPGGRLIFPLGVPGPKRPGTNARHAERGVALLITRTPGGLAAESLGPAYFVCAEGPLGPDDEADQRLRRAFAAPAGPDFVRSLVWNTDADPARCWFVGKGWALSYDPVS